MPCGLGPFGLTLTCPISINAMMIWQTNTLIIFSEHISNQLAVSSKLESFGRKKPNAVRSEITGEFRRCGKRQMGEALDS